MAYNKDLTKDELRDLVASAEVGFTKITAATGNPMVFQQEALFAMQAMLANDYLAKCAMSNQVSFKLAMAQIASSGLTLNPAMGLAYLVPRDGKVIADISYRGLIKIATDSRAVNLVVAQSVYSLDGFTYRGDNAEPVHQFDPFLPKEERGTFRGVYVKAYLAIGALLVTAVSAEEIYAARNMSKAWVTGAVGKKGPWESHPHPMNLKAGVKIARKFWPMTSPVLENVISYLNEDGGEGFTPSPVTLGVAAREMGVAQIGLDPTIAMPTMSVDPRVSMALNPEPVATPTAENVQPRVNREPVATRPEPIPSSTNAPVDVDASGVDPKMIERIESVIKRSQKMGTWAAAEDWVVGQLKGSALELGMKLLNEARAAALVNVA